jgi:hypothetical protein
MKLISFLLTENAFNKKRERKKNTRKTEEECINKFVVYDEAEYCAFEFISS